MREIKGSYLNVTHITFRLTPTSPQTYIMNLVVNARDAMPSGGSLNIEISEAHLDAEYCKQNPDTHPGSYVCIAVTDTRSGMSREVLSRLFEPFFTTKESGKGTGQKKITQLQLAPTAAWISDSSMSKLA